MKSHESQKKVGRLSTRLRRLVLDDRYCFRTGTTHCGDTRCRVRACGNENRTRPTRVAHLCFAPLLSERQGYEKRKAPRDDRPAEFQYCLRAWLSREPRRMGTPHGSSCEAVNDCSTAIAFAWNHRAQRRALQKLPSPRRTVRFQLLSLR
jgi:hypothetical protein